MQRLGRAEGTAVSCVAGAHDRQVGVQPVGLGGALGDELVAVVAEHLEVLGLPGVAGGWQVVLARGERAIAKASVGSDLPGRRSRRRSRTVSAQGTSRTSRPWSRRSRASRRRGWPRPRPRLGSAARFDRPRPAGHRARQGCWGRWRPRAGRRSGRPGRPPGSLCDCRPEEQQHVDRLLSTTVGAVAAARRHASGGGTLL